MRRSRGGCNHTRAARADRVTGSWGDVPSPTPSPSVAELNDAGRSEGCSCGAPPCLRTPAPEASRRSTFVRAGSVKAGPASGRLFTGRPGLLNEHIGSPHACSYGHPKGGLHCTLVPRVGRP